MVRRPVRGMLIQSLDAELRQGDLQRPDSLQRLLPDIDTVIHLGAMATFESYRKVRSSIIDGSRNLMRAAIDAGVKRFIYGGSLLIYSNQVKPIDQETEPRPLSGYGKAKLEAETMLAETARSAGIHFCSLRLPHIYGAKSLLFYQIRKRRIIFPGSGPTVVGHLHVTDAARALIEAAAADMQGTYVIADDLSCSWNDFLEITQNFYPRLQVIHIPKSLALLATSIIELLLRFQTAPNRYSMDAVRSWNLDLPVTAGTLADVLKLELRYPTIADGIPAVLDDCVAYTWQPSNYDP
jgi:nucleoside-diphosphate-sugar epimerase